MESLKPAQLHSIFVFLTVVSIIFMVTAIFFTRFNGVIIYNNNNSIILLADDSLPYTFFVNSTYDIPSRSSSVTWQSAIADYLESSFRSDAIHKKLISPDEYVKFSDMAIKTLVNHYIKEKIPAVASSFPSLLEKSEKMKYMAVMNSICKSENCVESIKYNNPIKFEIANAKYALTAFDIKALLYQTGAPLLLTIPQPMTEYWVPCNEQIVNSTQSCINKQPCPPFINSSSCGHLTFNSELPSSEYYQPKMPAGAITGDPVNLLIYGYTDDHVSLIGKNLIPSVKKSVGGFIVKKPSGNVIGFYQKTLAFQDNTAYCTRDDDPRNWRGPNFTCMKKKNNVTRCPAVKRDERRSKKSATILKCINENYCNTSRFYAMVQSPLNNLENVVYSDSNGVTTVLLYEWEQNKLATLIDYSGLPYQNLGMAFHRISKDDDENSKFDLCNYWFLPYDVVDETIMLSSVPTNRVHAVSLDIKWGKIKRSVIKESIGTVSKRIVTKHF